MSWRIAAGLEGPDRIFVCGHPDVFTEAKIRELLEYFGPLRVFNILKDKETGIAKGQGFCAYQDPSVTDIACAALHKMSVGDRKLAVRRAVNHAIQPKTEQELQIAMQRLMIQPRTVQDIQIALQRLMIQP